MRSHRSQGSLHTQFELPKLLSVVDARETRKIKEKDGLLLILLRLSGSQNMASERHHLEPRNAMHRQFMQKSHGLYEDSGGYSVL